MRMDTDFFASDVQKIAEHLGVKVVWRVARCGHGKSREQDCRPCENGYCDDTHSFGETDAAMVAKDPTREYSSCFNHGFWNIAPGMPLVGLDDTLTWYCYIPARSQAKVNAASDFLRTFKTSTEVYCAEMKARELQST